VWWNERLGGKKGRDTTLSVLQEAKVISIIEDGVVPYRKPKKT
jgi:hypothetical protein